MIKQNRTKEKGPHRNLRIQAGGQVVLMVLLASALILTLGLSASKQATVETKIDTDQELLKKAFNAAESGIEYYLGSGGVEYSGGENDGSANVSVSTVGESENLSFGNVTLNGRREYFWLVNHNDDGTLGSEYYNGATLDICNIGGSNVTFDIGYFYKNGSVYGVNNTIETTVNGCISDFNLSAGNPVLLSIMPVGGTEARIQLNGEPGVSFPSQGEEITSTGWVQGVNNTVMVLNNYVVPVFLLEAVTAGGNISNSSE